VFPHWKTVFRYFRAWHLDGTREKMNRAIRGRLRARARSSARYQDGIRRLLKPPAAGSSRSLLYETKYNEIV
jgi:transposase